MSRFMLYFKDKDKGEDRFVIAIISAVIVLFIALTGLAGQWGIVQGLSFLLVTLLFLLLPWLL